MYRQDFLVSKVLENIKDEFEEDYISATTHEQLVVRETDYDYAYKNDNEDGEIDKPIVDYVFS